MRKLCFFIGLLICTVFAQAQTVMYVTPAGAGVKDGTSWENAIPGVVLQSAINNIGTPGQIWVAKGTYSISSSLTMRNNVAIYGGFAGTEKKLSERDLTVDTTTLLGDGVGFVIDNPVDLQASAILDGFTITGLSGGVKSSGGLFNKCTITGSTNSWACGVQSSTGTFTNCAIIGNFRGVNSDGIFINCNISNNSDYNITFTSATDSAINCLIANSNDGVGFNSTGVFINSTIVGCANTGLNNFVGSLVNCVVWGNKNNWINNATITYSALQQAKTGTGNILLSSNNNDATGPQFADPLNGNFLLKAGSPLINKGVGSINTSTVDISGKNRIINGTIDIGAYEHGINVNVSVTGNDGKPLAYSTVMYDGYNYTSNSKGLASFDVDLNSSGSFFVSSPYYSDTVSSQFAVTNTDIQLSVSLKTKKEINKIYVTTTGTGKGTSWADALPADSLQYAINTVSTPGQVWVAKGLYSLSDAIRMRNIVAVYGGFGGYETNINERDLKNNVTVLSGETIEYAIRNDVTTLNESAILDGFEIKEGSTGGIYSLGGLFSNCSTSGRSSGIIYSTGIFANCNITGSTGVSSSNGEYVNCVISGNNCIRYSGGLFEHCSITSTDDVYGTGIGSSTGTFIGCTISGNSTGIYYSTGNYVNCLIAGNKTGVSDGASAIFTNCTIAGNTNGLSSFSGTLTNCIVWGNTSNTVNNPIITYTAMPGVIDGDGNIDLSVTNDDSDGPQFVDPANGDYHLSANSSLLIDAGLNTANTSTSDLEGKQRVIGSSIDLGAYERGIDVTLTVLGSDSKAVTNANVTYNGNIYKTNSNGIVVINVVPGDIALTATSVDYTDTIKVTLTVATSLSKTVSFTTLRQDVSVTVLDLDKKPLANATVNFDNKIYTTDSKGTVTIENVAQGVYEFKATSELYSDTATHSITVANAPAFDIVQLLVKRQTVYVTVIGSNGKPLNQATITFNKNNYPVDDKGVATLTNVSKGIHSFAASSVYYSDTVQGAFTVYNTEVQDSIQLLQPKPITVIHVTKNGAGTKDGSSWANAAAMTTLQTKINSVTQPAQIWIKAGTYVRSSALEMRDLVSIYGGFAGTEVALEERNPTTNVTTFDGGSSVNYLVYNNTTLQPTAIFDGFTLTKGSTGGIYSLGGTFVHCIVTANSNYGVASSTGTFVNCEISGNYEGVYSSTGVFTNTLISKNTSNGISGSDGTFNNCTITGNSYGVSASKGIFNYCNISGNSNSGVYNNEGVYENCVISLNEIGVYTSQGLFTNCLISNNSGTGVLGGAGQFTNCTIADANGSSAVENSGALFTNSIIWSKSKNNSFESSSVISYSAINGLHVGTGNIAIDEQNTASTGPHFVDPDNGNYQLSANSPLINAGLSSSNSTITDLDGKPRITGSAIDMGAYEHGIDVNVTILGVDDKPLIDAEVIYDNTKFKTNSQGIASFDVAPNSNGSFAATSKYYVDTVIDQFSVTNVEISKTVKLSKLKPATILRLTTAGAGLKDGSSWENALPADSLLSAINKVSIPGQIWVAKGNYSLTKSIKTRNDVAVYGGFAGTEDSLNKRSITVNETTLNGNKSVSYIIENTDSVYMSAIFDGFTLTNGIYGGISSIGGYFANCIIKNDSTYGIYESSGTFVNCAISNNKYGVYRSSGIFVNCSVENNSQYGIAYSSGSFTNCIIKGNGDGVNNSPGSFVNCLIVNNNNMGIYSESGTFTNCISWGNTSNEYLGNNAIMSYSATINEIAGTGNIKLDNDNNAVAGPHFINPTASDYHFNTGSPCVNSGLSSANTSATDFDGNKRIVGSSIDMGAFERELYVNATITVNGFDAKPLANAVLTCNGIDYITNSNGIATFEIKANSTGNIIVKSDAYSDTVKKSLVVAQSDTSVSVGFTAPFLYVTIQVNGSDNLPLNDAVVKYNGNEFKTNSNGIAQIKVVANTSGSFSATSDSYFDVVSGSFTVKTSDVLETVAFKNVKPGTIIASNELMTTELFTKWFSYDDKNDGGLSTISFSKTVPGANGTDSAVVAEYLLAKGSNVNSPYVGFGFNTMVDSSQSIDFSGASGVSFYHKGSACTFSVILPENIATDPNYSYYHVTVPAHSEWTKVSYSWADFAQYNWGTKYAFDASKIYRFQWQPVDKTGSQGSIMIDQMELRNVALTLLSVSANKTNIAANSNSNSKIYLYSNTAWTASSDQTWLTLNSSSGQSGYASLIFTATANKGSARTATVTISSGDKKQIITVTQLDASVSLNVSSASVTANAAKGSTATVVVTSNYAWSASSNQEGCSVSPSSGVAGTTTVTFTATEENTTASNRSAIVTFSINGTVYQSVTVTQEAADYLTVSSAAISIEANVNSTAKINIATNNDWTATSDQKWLTVAQSTISGSGYVTLTALTANSAFTTRTATISVVSGTISKQITVTQKAAVNNKPVVSDIPSQSISGSEVYTAINLSNYVTDIETPANEITWLASKSDYLTISITNNVATITPLALWNGVETVTFIAKDAQGATDSAFVTFARTNAPGSPTGKPTGTFISEKQLVSTGTMISFSLNTVGATSYSWSFDGGTPATSQSANPSVSYSKPGTYSVTLTLQNKNGITTISKSAYIVVMGIKQADTVICKSKSISLSLINAEFADSIKWSNGSKMSDITFTPSIDTTITAKFFVGLFTYSSSIKISIAKSVSLGKVGSDGIICVGSSQVLAPGSYVSYLWQDGTTASTYPIDTKNPKTYSVTVIDNKGCVSSSSVSVTGIKPLPIPSVTKNMSICSGSTAWLVAKNGISYLWNNKDNSITSSKDSLKISAGNTYYVTVTGSNGCIAIDTSVVLEKGLPIITATVDKSTICKNDSVKLQATGALTYKWSTGKPNGSYNVISSVGINSFTVTGTDNDGCSSTSIVSTTVNDLPTLSIPLKKVSVCNGDNVTLTASGATKFVWSNNVVNAQAFKPSQSGIYVVTGTNNNNCSDTLHVSVIINSLPTVTAKSSESELCLNKKVILSGSGASTYVWDKKVVNSVEFAPESTNTYTVTGTDGNGCKATATTVVNVLKPYTEQISIATYTEKGTAISVIWPYTKGKRTAKYELQRLSDSLGTYKPIVTKYVNNEKDSSYFVDLDANGAQQAYSYKLLTYDSTCNNYAISSVHKTIHLNCVQSSNASNEVSLMWNMYEGVKFNKYRVFVLNNTSKVDSFDLANDSSKFITRSYLKHKSGYKYRIGMILSQSITASSLKSDSGPFSLSLSNMAESELNNIGILESQVKIYPNPANSEFSVTVPSVSDVTVVNILGQIVEFKRGNGIISFSKVLPAGIYVIKIKSEGSEITRSLLIEN